MMIYNFVMKIDSYMFYILFYYRYAFEAVGLTVVAVEKFCLLSDL